MVLRLSHEHGEPDREGPNPEDPENDGSATAANTTGHVLRSVALIVGLMLLIVAVLLIGLTLLVS